MKVFVKAFPNSKEEKVSENEDGSLSVKVKAQAKDGKANKAIINILAKHFKVPKSSVNIKAGHTSRGKIVEIDV